VDDEQTLKKAVALLLEASPPGSQAILVGSRATGRARPDSDWDFLVVQPEVQDRFAEMARLAARLGEECIPADVIVMSRAAFRREQDRPHSLAALAREEGRVYDAVP